jgi:hypothetical protein
MDSETFSKMLKMANSDSDSDAVMGLRGLQGLFAEDGVTFEAAIRYARENLDAIRAKNPQTIEQAPKKGPGPVSVSGMPQCRVPKPGCVEIIAPGATEGAIVPMQGAAAESAEAIAFGLKDALVAAVINKSRFKLKVVDVKNGRGEVVETLLQAEYDREGMSPVRVWSNLRGEVAALATVLRKGVAASLPDLVAA